MIEVVRAKRQPRLGDEVTVKGDLLGLCRDLLRLVGNDVQRDLLAQVIGLVIFARKDRRIDQRFVISLGPCHAAAGHGHAIKRSGDGPAGREGNAGLHADLAHVMPGGIEAHLLPLQVEHFLRHGDAALAGLQRAGVDELGGNRLRAGGNVDVEGKDLDRIALPFERGGPGEEPHVDQLG